MATVTHGGRALTFAREHNIDYREVLDFSANINPLGPSPIALEAMKQEIDRVQVYPDEKPIRLIDALSNRLEIAADTIVAGNGGTELLYFWLRCVRPRTASLIVPTFVEYRKALQSVGTEIQTIQLHPGEHFRLRPARTKADVVIVTNPNNPTGSYAPPEEMLDWISRFDSSTHVFIDEAYVEFTAQPSLVRYCERFPNLWILRSMTKFYAIPGVRLGYLVGSGARALSEKREPWQVNALAEVAGLASIQDRGHEEITMQLILRERIWIWKQLQTLRGIQAFPTAANFFLAQFERGEMLDRLKSRLIADKILIRDCSNFEGLDGAYFRFAIKTRPENLRLLDHLRRL